MSVTASQSLEGAQNIRSPRCFSPRHQLQVCMKGLLKSCTVIGQHPVVKPNASPEPIELQRFVHTRVVQPSLAQTASNPGCP